jgi:hypothetical protein
MVKVVRVRMCPGFINRGRRNVTTEKLRLRDFVT